MRVVRLAHETDFDGWRAGARALRAAGVRPEQARFVVGDQAGGLFDVPPARAGASAGGAVPRVFLDLARSVVLHRASDRFDLLYRLLWRLGDEPDLIKVVSDADVAAALEREKTVRRAAHKMKAFVRFRRVEQDGAERWIAWFEPAHRVLEATAPFFARRFSTMNWAILTPDGCAAWDGQELSFGPPARPDEAPQADEVEDFWKTYYASTFNPARLRTQAMQGEMPKRYWKNLPEAALIPELVGQAAVRMEAMVAAPAPSPNSRLDRAVARQARPEPPPDDIVPGDLETLERAVQACRRCPLRRDATQGVCGEGARRAELMIVGEQPGDQEDLAGRPFVGPAGQLLDKALAAADIVRERTWLTNAVKHFKHEPRGKRRLHKTPNAGEVTACRWWLDAERRLVRPRVILALGATAGHGVLGRKPAVMKERSRPIEQPDGSVVLLTVHPSFLLRVPDEETRRREKRLFLADLQAARALL